MNKFFSSLLIWIVIFQIALPTSFYTTSHANDALPLIDTEIHSAFHDAFVDPIDELILNPKELPPVEELLSSDPSLDQDPFFLREQSWTRALPEESLSSDEEVWFSSTDEAVTVQIKGIDRSLRINQRLSPILYNDRYVLLSAKENFELFKIAQGNNPRQDPVGEGIFVLSIDEIRKNEKESKPSCVYFFPLPSGNWSNDVQAYESSSDDFFYLADASTDAPNEESSRLVLPILFRDIETLINIERFNYTAALAVSLNSQIVEKNKNLNQNDKNDIKYNLKNILDKIFSKKEKTKEEYFKNISNDFGSLSVSLLKIFQIDVSSLPPGSTAGFGLYYTGLNLDKPGFSYFEEISKVSQNIFYPSVYKKYLLLLFSKFSLISSTYADDYENKFLPADEAHGIEAKQKTFGRILRVLGVAGIAYAGAIVLKYTLLKDHFKKLNELNPQPKGTLGKIRREFSQTGTVFAHNLMFIDNFAATMLGASTEFMIDRFFPKLGAGENSLVRKFLSGTIYFTRNKVQKIIVSWETFVKGFGIFGLGDTLLVAYQLKHLVPYLSVNVFKVWFPSLGPVIDQSFQGMDISLTPSAEFKSSDGKPMSDFTVLIIMLEIIRNFAGYIAHGAQAFSSDNQDIFYNEEAGKVDHEMTAAGKDPYKAENTRERASRIDEKVEKRLRLIGLTRENFIYDVETIWQNILRFLGIGFSPEVRVKVELEVREELKNKIEKLPENKGKSEIDITSLVEEQFKQEGHELILAKEKIFYAAQRPGLLAPALKRAIQKAKELHAQNPNDVHLDRALDALESYQKKVSILEAFVINPLRALFKLSKKDLIDVLRGFRLAREELVCLTPIDQSIINQLPQGWVERYGVSGSNIARLLFQGAFLDYIRGSADSLDVSGKFSKEILTSGAPQLILNYHEDFEREVLERQRLGFSNEDARAEALESLKVRYPTEYYLICQSLREANDIAQKARVKNSFSAPKRGWVQKAQLWFIQKKSDKIFYQEAGHNFVDIKTTEKERWMEIFSHVYMNSLGLFPNYRDRLDYKEEVEKAVRSEMNRLAETQEADPDFKAWFGGLSLREQLMYKAILYGDSYIKHYLEVVGKAPYEAISARSTSRPGCLHGLRCRLTGSISTTILRTIEAGFPTDQFKLGGVSILYRSIPGAYDLGFSYSRYSRRVLTFYILGLPVLSHVWGYNPPWSVAVFNSIFLVALVNVPAQMLTRLLSNHGQKILSIKTLFWYTFIYSLATMWGGFPQMFYQEPFDKVFTGDVLPWVKALLATTGVVGGLYVGGHILKEKLPEKLLKKLKEKWKSIKTSPCDDFFGPA